ncbi:MAG: D-tyrosyl-tRNA(Tyr) deacylase [Acetobacteraceae bacterium]|nr:D-tyrosyl-tRNA(Tyr) deacylase [Acetobacteraceae bacterium]
MRAVVQRVSRAAVRVAGREVAAIGPGLLVLLGVGSGDTPSDARYLADKVAHLRCFEDEAGKMNRDLGAVGGEVLAVSQFTLYGDCRRGRRPSFTQAAPAAEGERLYRRFCQELEALGCRVQRGEFQAHMEVELVNDGPVTLLLDSSRGGFAAGDDTGGRGCRA